MSETFPLTLMILVCFRILFPFSLSFFFYLFNSDFSNQELVTKTNPSPPQYTSFLFRFHFFGGKIHRNHWGCQDMFCPS